MKKNTRKMLMLLAIFLIYLLATKNVFANTKTKYDYENKLDEFVKEIDEYTKENNIESIDFKKTSNDLLKGKGLDKKGLFNVINLNIFKEIKKQISSYTSIFIIIIIVNLINTLSDFNNESIRKISSIVLLLLISQKILVNYLEILDVFTKTITSFNMIMQISIPFITTLSALAMNISFSQMAMPSLLFMAQFSMVVANKIILPLSTLSIVFGVITYINEKNILKNFSKFLNKFTFAALATIFSVFLCILSLEGNISGNLDTLAGKTAKIATNTIPVVGKFVAESLGAIVVSCNLIKSVVGTLALITMVLFLITPLAKIIISILILSVFENIVMQIEGEFKISDLFSKFKDAYILLASVLVLTFTLFTISTGIMITMTAKI